MWPAGGDVSPLFLADPLSESKTHVKCVCRALPLPYNLVKILHSAPTSSITSQGELVDGNKIHVYGRFFSICVNKRASRASALALYWRRPTEEQISPPGPVAKGAFLVSWSGFIAAICLVGIEVVASTLLISAGIVHFSLCSAPSGALITPSAAGGKVEGLKWTL